MRWIPLFLFIILTPVFGQVSPSIPFSLDQKFLVLGDWDGWKFHPGDNIAWASPDFDDNDWKDLKPANWKDPLPDSTWPGYGWFRLQFEADSNMYNRILYLNFFTWGGADVFIDGKLFKSYGHFSSEPKEEVRYMPLNKLHQPIMLEKRDFHVIAIRISYHKAPLYKKLIGKNAGSFGFRLGFCYEESNRMIQDYKNSFIRTFYIASSMLLIILLLQGFLLWLLPNDRSNYYVTGIIFLLLLHSIFSFTPFYVEMDVLQVFIYQTIPFFLIGGVAFSLFPLTLSVMFHQKPKIIYKVLIFLSLLLTVINLILVENMEVLLGLFFLPIFIYSIKIFREAQKKQEKGWWFVALGFMGALIGTTCSTFVANFISFSFNVLTLFITMAYVSIPLGMTLFMAYRFYLLNTGLENKVLERTRELKYSLETLKATQAQLIQSEKMASLGELTAGIAHEIQNPLNFVNNFSEVSNELIDELVEEVDKGNTAEIKTIAKDVQQNLEKITHHGKRAGAIVKSMLAHSRTSTGKKEPTDLNALCDEYLRLAFHGMKAKDPKDTGHKTFNASFIADLSPDLPLVPLIPQDIGRVLLNLINNAFYAATHISDTKENEPGISHKPTVWISTSKVEDKVEIRVRDNGPGIPDDIKDKIFQPFFTTKPTGEGTGLGLSLTYDIITKGHGGELLVNSMAGEGTEFVIRLPE